jgi:hypothetical protein
LRVSCPPYSLELWLGWAQRSTGATQGPEFEVVLLEKERHLLATPTEAINDWRVWPRSNWPLLAPKYGVLAILADKQGVEHFSTHFAFSVARIKSRHAGSQARFDAWLR